MENEFLGKFLILFFCVEKSIVKILKNNFFIKKQITCIRQRVKYLNKINDEKKEKKKIGLFQRFKNL